MSEEHVEEIAQLLSKARYGPGLDMGGAHNPTPSEVRTARRFVEDAIAPLEAERDRLVGVLRELYDELWQARTERGVKLLDYLGPDTRERVKRLTSPVNSNPLSDRLDELTDREVEA